MRRTELLLAIGLALSVAGCGGATSDRQWMKVGKPYTVDEFRRDYADCSKTGTLDEDCMRSRGWTDMSVPKSEKTPEPTVPQHRY